MSVSQKSMNEIVAALNAGELTMDQLLEQIATDKQYVRRGTSFSELKYDGVSYVNGAPAKIFTLASEKIDRNGEEVKRKPRKQNGASA